ncbi:MAG TPA: AMP-binding protein, partial [Prolixibacteraceae bacterium]|nr:AMP-binding protein [Prolixibacteraceae bacterium]
MQLFDFTFGDLLEKYALETPDREFMVYPDRNLRFTYAQFNERVDQLAKGLLYIDVKPGDKVGIWANNVPDWLTFLFATAKIGAVLVTINTNYKLSELEYLLHNADIHTLCLVDGFRDSDYVNMIFELVPELKASQRGNLKSEKFPELKNVIFIGPQKHRGMYNTAELILLGHHIDDIELEQVKENVNTHDVVNMQYTSGTTGFPKGVMLTHHNILNNGYAAGECMRYTANDRLLVCVPLFHCFGCVLALCAIITHGATMVMVEDFDPLMVLASVEKEKCTALYGVPTMFIAELNHPMFNMFDLSS